MYPVNMMNTEITISPVANGWLVSIPTLQMNYYDPTGGMLAKLPGILKKIQDPEAFEETENATEQKPPMSRNKSLFVFADFEHVLAFLAKEIKDK